MKESDLQATQFPGSEPSNQTEISVHSILVIAKSLYYLILYCIFNDKR